MKLFILISLFAVLSLGCDNRTAQTSNHKSGRSPGADNGATTEEVLAPPPPRPPTRDVTRAAFSPDGKLLLLGYDGPGEQPNKKYVVLWDVETGKEIRGFDDCPRWIRFLEVLPKGDRALMSGRDNRVMLYEIPSGTKVWERKLAHNESVTPLYISGDGTFVINPDGELWNLADGKLIRRLNIPVKQGSVMALSPDGKLAFVGRGQQYEEKLPLRLWNVTEDRAIREFKYTEGWGLPIAFSPDSKYAVLGKTDGDQRHGTELVLWDLAADQLKQKFMHKFMWWDGVQFMADGKELYTSWETGDVKSPGLKFWDTQTGKLLGSFQVPIKKEIEQVCPIAVSRDGRLACIHSCQFPGNGFDITITLWDIRAKKMLHTLEVIRNHYK